jgi:hypothetical protein
LQEIWGLPDGHQDLVSPETARRVAREHEFGDIVLVPSSYVADQLAELSTPEARVVIQPFGVDLAASRPAERTRRPYSSKYLLIGSSPARGPVAHRLADHLPWGKGLKVTHVFADAAGPTPVGPKRLKVRARIHEAARTVEGKRPKRVPRHPAATESLRTKRDPPRKRPIRRPARRKKYGMPLKVPTPFASP